MVLASVRSPGETTRARLVSLTMTAFRDRARPDVRLRPGVLPCAGRAAILLRAIRLCGCLVDRIEGSGKQEEME